MKNSIIPKQPLSGTGINNYWSLLKFNRFNVHFKYIPRIIYTSFISAIATTPLSFIERLLKRKKIQEVEIKQPPIFIIGHWRSGTTFLHYLMAKDSNLGYISNAQSFYPGYMFHHFAVIVKKIIGLHIPSKRPMDDVVLTLDSPQEEEFALGNLTNHGCYHWWIFPKKMVHYFEKYTLLKNWSLVDYEQFKGTYLSLMKKIHLANHSKRLLIKNPVNTGRIPLLLSLFPNAQFIYLHRDPTEVIYSTIKLHTKLMENFSFQQLNKHQIEVNTINFHEQLLQKYNLDKMQIPKENLIEVEYKNLIQFPIETIQTIYNHLDIPNFDISASAFQDFIDLQKDYRADTYVGHQTIESNVEGLAVA